MRRGRPHGRRCHHDVGVGCRCICSVVAKRLDATDRLRWGCRWSGAECASRLEERQQIDGVVASKHRLSVVRARWCADNHELGVGRHRRHRRSGSQPRNDDRCRRIRNKKPGVRGEAINVQPVTPISVNAHANITIRYINPLGWGSRADRNPPECNAGAGIGRTKVLRCCYLYICTIGISCPIVAVSREPRENITTGDSGRNRQRPSRTIGAEFGKGIGRFETI